MIQYKLVLLSIINLLLNKKNRKVNNYSDFTTLLYYSHNLIVLNTNNSLDSPFSPLLTLDIVIIAQITVVIITNRYELRNSSILILISNCSILKEDL